MKIFQEHQEVLGPKGPIILPSSKLPVQVDSLHWDRNDVMKVKTHLAMVLDIHVSSDGCLLPRTRLFGYHDHLCVFYAKWTCNAPRIVKFNTKRHKLCKMLLWSVQDCGCTNKNTIGHYTKYILI